MTDRPTLVPPGHHRKVLLHSCCAPCSGEVMEAMTASGIDYTIFFYNPNIHPKREYEIRKTENIRFAEKHNRGLLAKSFNALEQSGAPKRPYDYLSFFPNCPTTPWGAAAKPDDLPRS